jgi:hypothetical protein
VPGKFWCRTGQLVPQQVFPSGAWQQVPTLGGQVSVVQAAWQAPFTQLLPAPQALVQEPQ